MAQATWDLSRVFLTVNGQRVTGAHDGDFVSIEWGSDRYETAVGADGTVVRSKLNNKTGTMTIGLFHGAKGNALLDGFRKRDDQDGSGVFAVAVTDIDSGTELVSADAWIQALPSIAMGRTVPSLEWTVACKALSLDVGVLAGI